MKPGWQTTEFLLTAIAVLIGLAATGGFITPDQADALTELLYQGFGLLAMVAATFGYNLSRGKAKQNNSATLVQDAKERAELDLIANQIKTEQIKREVYRSRLKK